MQNKFLVDLVNFDIEATPVGKGRPRFNPFGQPYTPAATRKFEKLVKDRAKEAMKDHKPFGREIEIHMRVSFFYAPLKSWSKKKKDLCISCAEEIPKLTKPDLTNLVKSIEDACNGVVYEDDANITSLSMTKEYYGANDGVHVHVEAWGRK